MLATLSKLIRMILLTGITISAQAACWENTAVKCEDAVVVIRHAEDTTTGPKSLTTSGKRHAELYRKLFHENLTKQVYDLTDQAVCLCPISRIVSIERQWTPNPVDTVLPFASEIGLGEGTIEYYGNHWNTHQRLSLLSQNNQTSTLISWTRQGLWGKDRSSPAADALLTKLSGNDEIFKQVKQGKSPMHDNVYIFLDQNQETGKFHRMLFYRQFYQLSKPEGKAVCYHRIPASWGEDKIFEPITLQTAGYDQCKW